MARKRNAGRGIPRKAQPGRGGREESQGRQGNRHPTSSETQPSEHHLVQVRRKSIAIRPQKCL